MAFVFERNPHLNPDAGEQSSPAHPGRWLGARVAHQHCPVLRPARWCIAKAAKSAPLAPMRSSALVLTRSALIGEQLQHLHRAPAFSTGARRPTDLLNPRKSTQTARPSDMQNGPDHYDSHLWRPAGHFSTVAQTTVFVRPTFQTVVDAHLYPMQVTGCRLAGSVVAESGRAVAE